MNRRIRPVVIVLTFWLAAFILLIAINSNSSAMASITGYTVNENNMMENNSIYPAVIVILFFTNIVTLFFLVREMAERPSEKNKPEKRPGKK